MGVDLKEIILLCFYYREDAVSASRFCSKLFKLAANSTNVCIHINVIVLISLVNTQTIRNSGAVNHASGGHA